MTIPLVLCQNRITGAKFIIPADRGFPEETFSRLEEFLPNESNIYRDGKNSYYVYITENYRYCALLEERKSDLKGKTQVIRYVPDDVIEFCTSIEHFSLENNREIIAYAHDVQYVMGTLIHRSVVQDGDRENTKLLNENLDEISSVVGILSGKDAFFRFKTGSFRERKMLVNVHGKFLKMHSSFKKFSMVHSKKLKLTFDYDKTPQILTYEIFDFIPYLMIENAVKYSPSHCDVDIELRVHRNTLVATVGNMGPLLYNDELSMVFDRGFRGENAIESKEKGQGLGLFHLKDALFDLEIGEVELLQRKPEAVVPFEGIPYTWTEIVLKIPIN